MSRVYGAFCRIACDQSACSNSVGDSYDGTLLFTGDEDPAWAIEDYEYLTVGRSHYCPNHWPDEEPEPHEPEPGL